MFALQVSFFVFAAAYSSDLIRAQAERALSLSPVQNAEEVETAEVQTAEELQTAEVQTAEELQTAKEVQTVEEQSRGG